MVLRGVGATRRCFAGTCCRWCLGGTLCPPVPHRERLVPAAPRGGVAKTRRCLMGNIWVRFFPLLCARSLARPCLAQAEYISQRTEHFSQRVRSSCDCKNGLAKTVLVQVWVCILCFEQCSRQGPRMANSKQWWVSGKQGSLTPWSQAKVWALWKLSDDMGLELEDGDIAGYVEKVGGGAPTKQAIAKYRVQFECDPDWYPGESTVEQ